MNDNNNGDEDLEDMIIHTNGESPLGYGEVGKKNTRKAGQRSEE